MLTKSRAILAVLGLLSSVTVCQEVAAYAGSIDPDFGCPLPGSCTGKITTPVGNGGTANAVAIQPDGRILVAGTAIYGPDSLALVRYTANGTLDSTFGCALPPCSGKVITVAATDSAATSIALQKDGRIVVAGYREGGGRSFAVARYTGDGLLDTSFGCATPPCDGVVTFQFGVGTYDAVSSVAIQPDGKIVVAGSSTPGVGSVGAIARLSSQGLLDQDFGCLMPASCSGKVTVTISGENFAVSAIALQGDGKIFVAGSSDSGGIAKFAVARLTDAGGLDTSFGCASPGTCGGIVSTPIGAMGAGASSVGISAEGKIVLGGYSRTDPQTTSFALTRHLNNGLIDDQFGCAAPPCSGIVTTLFGTDSTAGLSLSIQSSGKLVLTGYGRSQSTDYFAAARYTSAGILDSVFGCGIPGACPGYVRILNGESLLWESSSDAQNDEKVVIVGTSITGGVRQFAVTRLAGDQGNIDIDGDGGADALTDGLLMMRYLFGLRGEALIRGAVGQAATRKTAPEIEAYIQSLIR